MSRSGYVDYDGDDEFEHLRYGQWRGRLLSAIRGKRGQSFLRQLADSMDAMPEKILIAGDLIDESGDCCAIGVVCKARGIDTADVDPDTPRDVGDLVNIAESLASEIANQNDDEGPHGETPEQRWTRMRAWVAKLLEGQKP